jgi:DNA-directed RNA polymerase I subunit RPA49
MEFGNKKAKRAIAVMTENAVQSGVDAQGNLTQAAKVLLSAAAKTTKDMMTTEEMAAAAQAEKPRPKANLIATTPDQVYAVESLIPQEILDEIRIQDWLSMHASGNLAFKSRYVARRVGHSCQNKDVMKIKVLKYMLAAILFFKALKPGSRARKLPPKPKLDAATEAAESFLVDAVRKRFCKTSYVAR